MNKQSQTNMKTKASYNERLFSGGLRAKLHGARFEWLRDAAIRYNIGAVSVIELGCYDGRAVSYLPQAPASYSGYDAGWENGLTLARERWAARPDYRFIECRDPSQMDAQPESADLAMALETLEHIPPHLIDGYIEKIAATLKKGGYFFVSVPNEKGPVFAAKQLAKLTIVGNPEPYSFKEYCFQSLGMTSRVEWNDHKGFDYAHMIARLKKHFVIIEVAGIPFRAVPPLLNFGVGIIAQKK